MAFREPRQGEIKVFMTTDGRCCISIVRRPDGTYNVFVDTLKHDEEEDCDYWLQESSPRPGLFSNIETAVREIRSWRDCHIKI